MAAQKVVSTPILLRGRALTVLPERPYGTSYQMKMTTQTNRNLPIDMRGNRDNRGTGTFANRKAIAASKNTELISSKELSEFTGSFDEIADKFVKRIEAQPGWESKCEKVCYDLEKSFDFELPGVKARLFGSTITRLAFKESDIDIFMECPDEQPSKDFVAKNEHIMLRQKNIYSNLVTVSNARAPIFKFTHVETGLFCDVAFNDAIGLHHTDLIKFLLTFDKRLRPLFMVIKCWGFFHDVTNSGNMPNFALIMMIIFYLQQLKDQILPPVKFLQDLVKDNKVTVNGWNCDFCKDSSKILKNKNTLTLQSLLFGFFDYYSKFNYKNHVVCPFLNKLLDKSLFLDYESLPDDFKTYKENCKKDLKNTKSKFNLTTLCVQDPFNHAFNISQFTSDKHILRFFWLCGYNCEFIFKKGVVNIIKELFSPPVVEEPKRLVVNEKFSKDLYIQSTLLVIGDRPQKNDDFFTEEYVTEWYRYLKESILFIFEDLYKFEITCDPKLNTFNNDGELFSHLCFDYKGICPIYKDRSKIRKILHLQNNDCIESEISISKYIMENYKDVWCYISARFKMEFCTDNEAQRVAITMLDTSISKFNMFGEFAKYINTFLEDHCSQAFKYIAVHGFSKLPQFEASFRQSSSTSMSDNVQLGQKSTSTSSVSSTNTWCQCRRKQKKRK